MPWHRRQLMEAQQVYNIQASVTEGVAALIVPEPLTMHEWGNEYFWLSEESSSISGPWESLPYQVAWLNWFGNEDIEVIDCQKAARLGYTKCVIIAVGYFTEHKKRNMIKKLLRNIINERLQKRKIIV